MTLPEVAKELRCSPRLVSERARKFGIGARLGGTAGWRFTEADVAKLLAAMRPVPAVPVRRRRRRSA
ncbi:hypothetical protein [Nocardioides speluncae]|uniref:hypothetical protein n=1 Tax=Nocardioides speluncae TaxID=2670337 RepID=UPI000D68E6DA|nr:hypothetical protein [Nocardioides speluncae]